jgi:hypothetical protein
MKALWMLMLLALPIGAQTQNTCGPDSSADKDAALGDVARQQHRSSSVRPRATLGEEDLTPSLPIPSISVESATNDNQILDAYRAYLQTHARSDAENMLRTWYESELATYAKLVREVETIHPLMVLDQSAPEDDADTRNDDPEDANAKARERAAVNAVAVERNRQIIQRDTDAISHIVAALVRLREVFDPKKRVDWFNTDLPQPSYEEAIDP